MTTIFISDILKQIEEINRFSTKNLNQILRVEGLPQGYRGDYSIWRKRQILLQDFIDNYEEPFGDLTVEFWVQIRGCISILPYNTRLTDFTSRIEEMRELYIYN